MPCWNVALSWVICNLNDGGNVGSDVGLEVGDVGSYVGLLVVGSIAADRMYIWEYLY